MTRRKRPSRRALTAELMAHWLPDFPEARAGRTLENCRTEAELLDVLGRAGLDHARQMRREQAHGMLVEVAAD